MKKYLNFILIFGFFHFLEQASFAYDVIVGGPKNPWPKFVQPTPGPSESIGSYSAGCLAGAINVPLSAPGYEVMRPSRSRFFAHSEMFNFLFLIGEQSLSNPLLIGDLAQPRGGPTNTAHVSHQTGLDVDIWYLRFLDLTENLAQYLADKSPGKQIPNWREEAAARSVVNRQKMQLNSYWSEKIEPLLLWLSAQPQVDRFFVHPVIKKYFCNKYSEKHAHQKMRPWYGHDDHFHVRLKCPADDKDCTAPAPISDADDCGKELDWWFGDEANNPGNAAKTQKIIQLPERCRDLTRDLM